MPTLRPLARFALHDLPIEIACDAPAAAAFHAEVERVLGPYRVAGTAPRAVTGRAQQPTVGMIRPYDEADVLRHLSPRARRVVLPNESGELYEEGERFWRIDDRWGMVEINLLKSQWRAWVLPQPRADFVRCVEACVLWPMAQLLRAKGLYLLPAASIVRGGYGLLLLSPLGLAPELTTLVRAGCRVVGQRWTALRERDGRIEMLHLPGVVERSSSPHVRLAGSSAAADDGARVWTDLAGEHYGCEIAAAACDGVFVIQRGRRPTAHLRPLGGRGADETLAAIRAGWPIEELHPLRRHGQLPAKLAARCAAYEVALSRDPHDLLGLLGALPQRGTGIGMTLMRPAVAQRSSAIAV